MDNKGIFGPSFPLINFDLMLEESYKIINQVMMFGTKFLNKQVTNIKKQ